MMRWNSFDRPPRSKDHGLNLHSTKWGLGLREDQADDFTWLNNMPVEGLLSLYRGGKHDLTSLGLEKFRNSEVEDLEAGHLGGGARRMSITNAIDILRERVLRAIKKKKDRQDEYETVWSEPGLANIG